MDRNERLQQLLAEFEQVKEDPAATALWRESLSDEDRTLLAEVLAGVLEAMDKLVAAFEPIAEGMVAWVEGVTQRWGEWWESLPADMRQQLVDETD